MALFAASSCIRENTDGCPAKLSLIFELDDPYSAGNFDSDIGNDIELQLFRNDLYSDRITIPYSQIRNGRPYTFQKKCSDRVRIAAYALPAGQSATIPSPGTGDSFYDQYIRMEQPVRTAAYAPYGGTLYLGTTTIEGGSRSNNRYRVAMSPCFAKVIVLVVNAETFVADPSRTLGIGIEGTAATMRIHDRSTSSAIEVRTVLKVENEVFTTGQMRILASETPGQNLKVNLYNDDDLLMYVLTEHEAVAGKEIIIKINPGDLTAEITIDGWTYKTQVVTP